MYSLPSKLNGIIRASSGNGRKIGYPTANLNTETTLRDGVYFGYANLNKFKDNPALIFIGAPITLGDKKRRIEAHLLGVPDVDYYGSELQLEIITFRRPNQKFSSAEELIKAMRADEVAANKWFAKHR